MMNNSLAMIIVGAVIVLALIVAVIVLFVRYARLRRILRDLTAGKDGASLESVIRSHTKELENLDREIHEFYDIANKIHVLANKGIHQVGFLRFNPFKDLGGDQSFALALMNGKKDGVVISSLHTREGTRIYAKSIRHGKSTQHPFSKEEEIAIAKAYRVK